MSTPVKPTYEELSSALLHMDDAFAELFAQCASNPVTNAWGQQISFAEFNKHREQASSTITKLRQSLPLKVGTDGIQQYLVKGGNEYDFKDLILDQFVKDEQRRQSKNEPEIQSWHDIARGVEEDINNNQYPLLDVILATFIALGRAAKGEKVE